MEIQNHTRLSVGYRAGSPDLQPDLVVGQVVGKVLGHWDPAGNFELGWDKQMPLIESRTSTPWGDVVSDYHHLKAGCDVTAVGAVYSEKDRGATEQRVTVRVGQTSRSLVVFGERRWKKEGQTLVPSPPQPFGRLDLRWEHSFGGSCRNAQGQLEHHPFNPGGTGVQSCKIQALGARLPRVEDPDALMQGWDARPMPCSLAAIPQAMPLALYPDPAAFVAPLLRRETLKLPREFHNCAHPKFRFSHVAAGDPFALTGMALQGPLRGSLPAQRFVLCCFLGARRHEVELRPSTLQFFPETRCISITYSAHFAFRWVPQEVRKILVREVG